MKISLDLDLDDRQSAGLSAAAGDLDPEAYLNTRIGDLLESYAYQWVDPPEQVQAWAAESPEEALVLAQSAVASSKVSVVEAPVQVAKGASLAG